MVVDKPQLWGTHPLTDKTQVLGVQKTNTNLPKIC